MDHLRSSASGTIGQGIRFAVAGGVVAFVYMAITTVLADGFAVTFQLALIIGCVTAVCVHFSLQRWFVWVHDAEFALGFSRQVGRYLIVAAAQYVLTATSTALLPSAIGVPVMLVYFVTVLAIGVSNFLIFRNKIFYAG